MCHAARALPYLTPNPAAVSTIDRKSAGEYCAARSKGSDNVNSGQEALAKAKAWGRGGGDGWDARMREGGREGRGGDG